ncbi:MAG: hypothetical protein ABI947_14160 [Chloroflexota bacterium]
MYSQFKAVAEEQWVQVRRRVVWSRLLDNVKGSTDQLIDFNTVAHRLGLKNTIFRGAQVIPLDQIVGSVGRYQDFTRAFLPINEAIRDRWQRIVSIQLDPSHNGLPPIEVYKVGNWYFVKDGNHRVSVAHTMDYRDIEAYVWEYTEPLPDITPETDIDRFLIEAERLDFLNHTALDTLRPDHNIRLSTPGGYTDLLYRIAAYQDVLSQIDGVEVPYAEAVTAWYDMIYETSIQIIEQDGLLELFPDRTAADFFVWVMRHHALLREWCDTVTLDDTIEDLKKQQAEHPVTRMLKSLLHKVRR